MMLASFFRSCPISWFLNPNSYQWNTNQQWCLVVGVLLCLRGLIAVFLPKTIINEELDRRTGQIHVDVLIRKWKEVVVDKSHIKEVRASLSGYAMQYNPLSQDYRRVSLRVATMDARKPYYKWIHCPFRLNLLLVSIT